MVCVILVTYTIRIGFVRSSNPHRFGGSAQTASYDTKHFRRCTASLPRANWRGKSGVKQCEQILASARLDFARKNRSTSGRPSVRPLCSRIASQLLMRCCRNPFELRSWTKLRASERYKGERVELTQNQTTFSLANGNCDCLEIRFSLHSILASRSFGRSSTLHSIIRHFSRTSMSYQLLIRTGICNTTNVSLLERVQGWRSETTLRN